MSQLLCDFELTMMCEKHGLITPYILLFCKIECPLLAETNTKYNLHVNLASQRLIIVLTH